MRSVWALYVSAIVCILWCLPSFAQNTLQRFTHVQCGIAALTSRVEHFFTVWIYHVIYPCLSLVGYFQGWVNMIKCLTPCFFGGKKSFLDLGSCKNMILTVHKYLWGWFAVLSSSPNVRWHSGSYGLLLRPSVWEGEEHFWNKMLKEAREWKTKTTPPPQTSPTQQRSSYYQISHFLWLFHLIVVTSTEGSWLAYLPTSALWSAK